MIDFIEVYKSVNKSPEFIKLCECSLDYAEYATSGTYQWYEYNNDDMPRFADGVKSITTCAPWVSKDINKHRYDVVYNHPAYVKNMNKFERFVIGKILAHAYKKYMQRYL